ncbi:hypothetical protein K470DRAFT_257898, partial [Piedraia hortae CBS 480.64]
MNVLFEVSRSQCTLFQACARLGRCVVWWVEFVTSLTVLNRPNITYNCRKQS